MTPTPEPSTPHPDRASETFRVAFTGDFYQPDGTPKYQDIGLSILNAQPGIKHHVFREHRPEIGPDQLEGAQGVVVLTPSVTAKTVSQARDLLIVSRFGVGYDAVDVRACTAADVLVAITVGAVDRPVAEATVGWMIALSHHVRIKDGLVRTGRWDDRSKYMGRELRERTLGIIGLGGIGRKTLELLAPFGMNPPLTYDPYLPPQTAAQLGVRQVPLDDLLRQSDFVSIHCPLTEQTRGMIGARELGLMKPEAYLINTARGGIVDEGALYEALRTRRLAGAAIDCFEKEPVTQPHRLGELDHVLLAPHSIAWTEEMFRDIGRAACQVMVDLCGGRRPAGVLNPAVLDSPGFRSKWRRYQRSI